jgi:hypothetical protein
VIIQPKNNAGALQAVALATGYATLTTGTYYYEITDGDVHEIATIQLQLASGAVASDAHLEACNFVDTADHGSNLAWVSINPASASVPVSGSAAATAAVVTGSAGSALYNVAGLGARRLRLVVTLSTGGDVRVGIWKGGL